MNAGELDTSLSDAIDHTDQWGNPARQRPLRGHLRRPELKPPRPRRPLDLLSLALPPEGVYQDIKREAGPRNDIEQGVRPYLW